MPDPAVTLRDVARQAGVHPATASRALNPETRLLVSDATARRITEAAAALGYRPNAVARSLRTRRSHTVGVLIPDLNNPLFPPMVRGLEDRLAADGYVALIGNTDGRADRERQVFEQMRARQVDGFAVRPGLVVFAEAFTIAEGHRLGRRLLAARPAPTAVAAANDMLAVGCCEAIEEAGLSCPGDVSVTGFNDMPFMDRLRPPLTTVAFPHYQLGTEAAALLLARLAGHRG